METHALRQDHTVLRRKLTLLESTMQVAPEAKVVLREMCFSLQRFLMEHMVREARACEGACLRPESIGGATTALQPADHAAALQLLRAVNDLLQGGMRASLPLVMVRLSKAIEVLETQMAEQEQALFPVVERALESPSAVTPEPVEISCGMSVNEILRRYPSTAPVFQQFNVNRWREGYESLDELAWRCGLDVAELLDSLQRAAVTFPHN